MTALMLDPHGDDAVLFACFTLLRHKPDVVVVLRSQVQEDRGTGITHVTREYETDAALETLGLGKTWTQWSETDRNPDWSAVEAMMVEWRNTHHPEIVFAPAYESGGHDQHNAIGNLAALVFGDENVTRYLTYRRGSGRSDWGDEVVPEPEWIIAKHQALACFESQIHEPSTRPWFMDGLREWVA